MRFPLALLALTLVACQSNERRLAFDPSPYRAEILDPDGDAAARLFLAVPGAVATLEDGREGPFLQVLLRIENLSTSELTFDPARIVAVDDELVEFGRARIEPAGPRKMAAGTVGNFTLFLPYPEDVGMFGSRPRGLDLRVVLERGDTEIEAHASLQRVLERREAPYYGPYPGAYYGPYAWPWYDPWYPASSWHYWTYADWRYRDHP